jgi:hypothetical protein
MKNTLLIILALVLFSCKKDKEHDHHHYDDDIEITITLTSPQENAVFEVNDPVQVLGSISATGEIHGYIVELINNTNNDSVLYTKNLHTHGELLNFNELWTNNLSITSDVTVKITAFANHEGTNIDVLNRQIQCNGL